jgi:hypothetical protein
LKYLTFPFSLHFLLIFQTGNNQPKNGKLKLISVQKNWHPGCASLCSINPVNGKLSEALTLPSGGDKSHAGMIWHKNILWVNYYSSHKEKTSVYLAKVQIVE